MKTLAEMLVGKFVVMEKGVGHIPAEVLSVDVGVGCERVGVLRARIVDGGRIVQSNLNEYSGPAILKTRVFDTSEEAAQWVRKREK